MLLSIYVNLCLYCVYLLNLYTYLFIGVKHIDIDVDMDCHLLSRAALPHRTSQESSTVNSLSLAGNRLGPDDAQQLCESCCKCEAPLFQRKSNQQKMLERGTWKSRRTWSCASRNGSKSVAAAGCFQWVSILMVLHQVHHVPVTQWQRSQLSQHVPAPTKRRQALQVLLLQQKLGHVRSAETCCGWFFENPAPACNYW